MAAAVTFTYEFVPGNPIDPVEFPDRIKEIQTMNDPEADPPIVDEIISANQFSLETIEYKITESQNTVNAHIEFMMYWNDLKTRLEIMVNEN